MSSPYRLLTLSFLVLSVVTRAQVDEMQSRLLQVPVYFSCINPDNAIGIFALDLPFYFPAGDKPDNQLSLSYTMANTWHPQAWFYYPQNLTSEQSQVNRELYMTWRPTYFQTIKAETKVKTFQSDGVLQHFRFAWLKKWNDRNSFILNVNAHLLSGGASPLHYLVSDHFIEAFHSNFAVDDNYGRKLYPFNRANIQFIDEDGKKYRKDKGDWFASIVDMHYYRQLLDRANGFTHFQLHAGLHLSIPLNRLHEYLIPGVSTGIRLDKLTNHKTSVTLAVDMGVTAPTFLKTGSTMKAIDKAFRHTFKLYVGGNVVLSDKSILQFGLLNNVQGALLKGAHNGWGQDNYDEVGVRFLEEGDVWEGEDISQEFWLAKITPASLYFFSYKAYLVIGWQRKLKQFNIYFGEDFFYINNAPDFQLGVEYVFPLSWKK